MRVNSRLVVHCNNFVIIVAQRSFQDSDPGNAERNTSKYSADKRLDFQDTGKDSRVLLYPLVRLLTPPVLAAVGEISYGS